MRKWLLVFAFGYLFSVTSSFAGDRCYSPAEFEAEQALRLHSELMVITVTCKRGSYGEDLVRAYTGFTQNNIAMLRNAEGVMTAYYKKVYGGKGVERLDKLRTKLANEFGQEIAAKSAPSFCAEKQDRVLALYNANPRSVKGAVMEIDARTYEPPCSSLKKAER